MKTTIAAFFFLFAGFAGLASAQPRGPECIRNNDGSETCGFHCIKDSYGHSNCAQTPLGACVKNNFGNAVCQDPGRGIREPIKYMKDNFGNIQFGYHCMKDNYGNVKCAQTPLGACAKDNFGQVTCVDPSHRETRPIEYMKDNFGKLTFGYHCMKDAWGQVQCAQTSRGRCEKDNFGKVSCFDSRR